MATTQLSDIIAPEQFTGYILENTATKSNLVKSGLLLPNAQISTMLQSGSTSFNIPFWRDIANGDEADIISDNPEEHSTPKKITSYKQVTRKAYLHNSWSSMGLSAEIAGSNPLEAIQERVKDYWQQQLQKRLIASLKGVLASNKVNDAGDMVHDISTLSKNNGFSSIAVIDTAATLGDSFGDVVAIAMHSKIYFDALKNDLIQTIQDSSGKPFQTFRGLMVIIDDGLTPDEQGNYLTVLLGRGAFGYGIAPPKHSNATAVEVIESAGYGGGMQILHSRLNVAIQPLGFSWVEADLQGESPTIAELAKAEHWKRVTDRKNIPLAFLISK
ncbi:major capsid protein [Moraxella haemolytica]|uniref:major capsid protein n=1 Tax=Moraxella haemolytica TaxID=2904119 RepID=UPI0025437DBA|nr:major capsid protein [Moraxella sp. ZY171148]WII94564.1 major capsid protein [Moraxella sp. ZY171148]